MSDLETNGPDVPVRPTQGGDERLTRGVDNELAWTPDPEPQAPPVQLTPDDIANATANAGTVSGEQLVTLKPPQLTPDDIANATDNAGIVSGEQLAALGGGGPEILKDWTYVDQSSTNITEGIDFGSTGMDGLTIEIKGLEYDGGASGSILSNLSIRGYVTGKVAPTFQQSEGSGSSSSAKLSPADDFFQLMTTSFGVSRGRWVVEVNSNDTIGLLGFHVEGHYLPKTFTGLYGSIWIRNIMGFREEGNTPSEIWIQGEVGEPLSYEYRIIRKQ